jgi:hypothetical protein
MRLAWGKVYPELKNDTTINNLDDLERQIIKCLQTKTTPPDEANNMIQVSDSQSVVQSEKQQVEYNLVRDELLDKYVSKDHGFESVEILIIPLLLGIRNGTICQDFEKYIRKRMVSTGSNMLQLAF